MTEEYYTRACIGHSDNAKKTQHSVKKTTKPKPLCVMLGNMPQLLTTDGVQSLYKVFIELCSSYNIYGIFLFKKEKNTQNQSIFMFKTQY